MKHKSVMSPFSSDREFLHVLETRVAENREYGRGENGESFKEMAAWLGVHPWRVLVPVAMVMALSMAIVFRGWLLVLVSHLQGGF